MRVNPIAALILSLGTPFGGSPDDSIDVIVRFKNNVDESGPRRFAERGAVHKRSLDLVHAHVYAVKPGDLSLLVLLGHKMLESLKIVPRHPNLVVNECYPGADSDGGGDLPAGVDCRGEQAADRSRLSGTSQISALTDLAGTVKDSFACSVINTAAIAGAVCIQWVRRRTGVVLCLRSSVR